MMTKKEQRWYLEYVWLPEAMYGENASDIVQGILFTKQQFFINVYNNINAEDLSLFQIFREINHSIPTPKNL